MNVVQIIASPRSGSTLLALILANRPTWSTLGRFPENVDGEFDVCSCGKRVDRCNVRKQIEPALWDPLPRPFKQSTDRFLRRVGQILRIDTLVETSRLADRAIAYAGAGYSPRIVHLLRDPRDIFVERPEINPKILAFNWVREQKQALMLESMVDHFLTVRFEDLVAGDPLESPTWLRLWEFLGADPVPAPEFVGRFHVVGNRETLAYWDGELDPGQVGKWETERGERMSTLVRRLLELSPSPFRRYAEVSS